MVSRFTSLFRRTPRPRLLGETRPTYSKSAADCFAALGAAGALTVHARTAEDRSASLRDLDLAVTLCQLYANDPLLEITRRYDTAVRAYTEGNATRADVDQATETFYAACREALGTDKD